MRRLEGSHVKEAPTKWDLAQMVLGYPILAAVTVASSLACGWLGMTEKIDPNNPVEGNAYRYAFSLSRHLTDALSKLNHSRPLKDVLGARFVAALNEVKNMEYDAYQQVISSWERENLLLNV